MGNYNTVMDLFQKPEVIEKYFIAQTPTHNALYYYLNGKPVANLGKIQYSGKNMKIIRGGTNGSWEVPVLLDDNTNIVRGTATQALSANSLSFGDRARFAIKHVIGTIPINDYDMDLNKVAKDRVADIYETVLEQCKISVQKIVGPDCYAAGTENGGLAADGLQSFISATPSSGVVGGIDSGSKTAWRNIQVTGSSFASNGLSYLTEAITKGTVGTEKPTLGLCGNTVWGYLHKALVTQQHYYTSDANLLKAGFTNIQYMGVTFCFDSAIEDNTTISGRIYLINTNMIEYAVLEGCDMKVGKPIEPALEQYAVMKFKHRYNFIPKHRKSQVVITTVLA